MTPTVCIDFGTAMTRAVVVGQEPASAQDVTEIPSLALFDGDRIGTGEAAALMAGALDDLVGRGLKRLIGRRAEDPQVQRLCSRAGLSASGAGPGLMLQAGPRRARVLDGVAAIVRAVADTAGVAGPFDAMLVVPAWLGEGPLSRLAQAAKTAGAASVSTVRDTAAALLWQAHAARARGIVAIADLGAGGIGVAIAELQASALRMLADQGSERQGGDDVDAELAQAAIGRAGGYELVRRACEALKREFAVEGVASAEREVLLVDRDEPLQLRVQRWELEILLGKLASAAEQLLWQAVARVAGQKIDGLLLAGGMAHFSSIEQRLCNLLAVPVLAAQEQAAVLGAAVHVLGQRTGALAGLPMLAGAAAGEAGAATGRAPAARAQVFVSQKEPVRARPDVVVRRVEPKRSAPPPPIARASVPAPPIARASVPAPPIARASVPAPPIARVSVPPPPIARASLPPAAHAPAAQISAPPPASTPVARASAPAPAPTPVARASVPPRAPTPVGLSAPAKSTPTALPGFVAAASWLPPALSPGAGSGLTMAPPSLANPMFGSEGELFTPQDAEGILALAISRPLGPGDLEPIALPVLCRRLLARKDRTGTLILGTGTGELRVDVVAGAAQLDRHEHAALMECFDRERGRYRFVPERFAAPKREPIPLARIALEGVRRMLRGPTQPDLERAFADRMKLAPRVRPEQATTVRRMGLSPRELRFCDLHLDGRSHTGHLCDYGGLGRLTVLQLLAVFDLFAIVDWAEPEQPVAQDPAAEVAAEADRIARAHFFDVLGVHWSAGDSELKDAYLAMRDRYAKGGAADLAAPAACAAIRARVDEAYEALQTASQRTAYRRATFAGQDFASIADLEQKRSAALAMRGDARGAARSDATARELSRSIDESRLRELQQRAARRVGPEPPKK